MGLLPYKYHIHPYFLGNVYLILEKMCDYTWETMLIHSKVNYAISLGRRW
jgi:hypothetical protein